MNIEKRPSILEEWIKEVRDDRKNLMREIKEIKNCGMVTQTDVSLVKQKLESCSAERIHCQDKFTDHEARTRVLERGYVLNEDDVNKIITNHPELRKLSQKIYIGIGVATAIMGLLRLVKI